MGLVIVKSFQRKNSEPTMCFANFRVPGEAFSERGYYASSVAFQLAMNAKRRVLNQFLLVPAMRSRWNRQWVKRDGCNLMFASMFAKDAFTLPAVAAAEQDTDPTREQKTKATCGRNLTFSVNKFTFSSKRLL